MAVVSTRNLDSRHLCSRENDVVGSGTDGREREEISRKAIPRNAAMEERAVNCDDALL